MVAKFLDKADDQFPFRKRCMRFSSMVLVDAIYNEQSTVVLQ